VNHRPHKRPVSDSSTLPERRVKQRTRLQLKADVTLPGDLTIVGHTLDISSSGLSLDVPYQLQPGQRCEIELNLIKVGGPKWVQVIGEVTRCVTSGDGHFQAGLQFVDLDAQLAGLLDAYIWSRIKQ
jgi:PilZ domain